MLLTLGLAGILSSCATNNKVLNNEIAQLQAQQARSEPIDRLNYYSRTYIEEEKPFDFENGPQTREVLMPYTSLDGESSTISKEWLENINPTKYTGTLDDRTNEITKYEARIFFDTNNSRLSTNDISDLEKIGLEAEKLFKKGELKILNISAHTDNRKIINGKYNNSNEKLSKERGLSVIKELQKYTTAPISLSYYGSKKLQGNNENQIEDKQYQRQVHIAINKQNLHQKMDMIKGDIYLLDASGSMMRHPKGGWSLWDQIKYYSYPQKSKVNIATRDERVLKDTTAIAFDRIGPTSQYTNIHQGTQEIINKTKTSDKDANLIVISDGKDNVSKYSPEEIINSANKKHLHIYYITLINDLNERDFKIMNNIATKTGGRILQTEYFNNNK